jgi:hypothetical protein
VNAVLSQGTKVLVGIRNGVLTVVDPETERHTSIPWPPPPPKPGGAWRPARVGYNEDGNPVLLWNWEPGRVDAPPPADAVCDRCGALIDHPIDQPGVPAERCWECYYAVLEEGA